MAADTAASFTSGLGTDTAIGLPDARIDPIYVPVAATCAALGLSKVTVYRLIAQGKLRAVKAGAKTLIEVTSIREYAASLPRFIGTTGLKAA
jgi:excisionase family DNA binding protein